MSETHRVQPRDHLREMEAELGRIQRRIDRTADREQAWRATDVAENRAARNEYVALYEKWLLLKNQTVLDI